MRCPWVVNTHSEIASFEERRDIVFLGGYRHKPNVEAVEFFCKSVFPALVDRLPDVKFRVYGSHLPESLKEYESENVIMHGFIEDVSDVYRGARLFVSPLLSGAGIKGKILECMASGLPSVISGVTAEGTGLIHSQSTFVADTVSEWCEYIEILYNDKEKWEGFSRNSLSIAESIYSPTHGKKQMSKILERVDIYSSTSNKFKFSEYAK